MAHGLAEGCEVKIYYNDNDISACAWLKELMADGLIAQGDIDNRSILEVQPHEIKDYTRIHLFAGLGLWDLALRLADYPDDERVLTASCPCPPFSCAGKKKACPRCKGTHPVCCPRRTGFFICCDCGHAWNADGRHLWPEVWRLIRGVQPTVCLGEQVASEDGRVWLAGVRATMEILGFDFGAADCCSAGVGSPNIRQRLYWVAQSGHEQSRRGLQRPGQSPEKNIVGSSNESERSGGGIDNGRLDDALQIGRGTRTRAVQAGRDTVEWLGEPNHERPQGHAGNGRDGSEPGRVGAQSDRPVAAAGGAGGVGNSESDDEQRDRERETINGRNGETGRSSYGHWSASLWHPCRDGKVRRIPALAQPGIQSVADDGQSLGEAMAGSGPTRDDELFPLAPREKGRVGLLRGAGNAINPILASEFIKAFLEAKKLMTP